MKKHSTFYTILFAVIVLGLINFNYSNSQENRAEQTIPYYLKISENENENYFEVNEAPPRKMNPLSGKEYNEAFQQYLKMPEENLSRSKKDGILTTTAWQAIGAKRVTVRGFPNIGIHGRFRSIYWYGNSDNNQGYWQPWLGASSGGIWYKDHFPANPTYERWLSAGDNLPNPAVGALYVKKYTFSETPQTDIFAGTGDWNRFSGAGLFHSSNSGRTWFKVPLMSGTNEIIPGAITTILQRWGMTQDTLFVSSDAGFFRSTNGGYSFSRIAIVPGNEGAAIFDMVHDETNLSILYAGLPGFGIYKTTNSGTSWIPVNNGIDVTTNMGSSISIAISKTSPNILYAALANSNDSLKGIYRTTNGGDPWTNVPNITPYMGGGQAMHVNCISINPVDPNKIYAGSVGLIRSINGGTSWDGIDGGHSDYTHISFHPDNPNLLYITNDGGIFIRDETTNTIQNTNELFYPCAPIQEYGMDYAYTDPNTLVSGTQDNGTLVSMNTFPTLTNNWEQMTGCDGGNNVVIDPTDANYFYFNSWCGTVCPRMRSSDKGAHADNIDNGLTQVYYTPININKFGTNYLFTVTSNSLYYSTNRGDNWLRADRADSDFVSTEAPQGIAVNSHSDSLVCYVWFWMPRSYVPTDPNPAFRIKVFKGTPGNMSVTTSNPVGIRNVSSIVADQFHPNIAYAFTNAPEFLAFRTTNQGLNWYRIQGYYSDSSLPNVPIHSMVSQPTDSNTIYAGNDFGVFKTTNAGFSWNKYQYGLPIVPVMDMSYIRSTPNDILKIGTYGRGYWYRELNGTDPIWQQGHTTINRGLRCPDSTFFCKFYHKIERIRGVPINPLGPCFMIANDQGNIERTFDGGMTWEMKQLPTKEDINDITSFVDGSVYAVGEQGGIFSSIDFGTNWTASISNTTQSLKTIAFLGNKVGYAAGSEGLLLRTDDGGANWTSMKFNSHYEVHNLNFFNAQIGVATGLDYSSKPPAQFLIATTDGGFSWIPMTIPNGCQLNKIYFKDAQTTFILGSKGEILRSGDFGQSWKSCSNNMFVGLNDMKFSSSDVGWICGDNGTILKTTDAGNSWYQEETPLTNNIYSIAMDSTTALAIGDTVLMLKMPTVKIDTSAGGVHIINVNITPTNVEDNDLNFSFKCYPNPFSVSTNIDFQLVRAEHLTLSVYDIMGRKLADIADAKFEAGNYNFVYNAESLPTGVYYLRLSSLNHNETQIITLIK